MGQQNNLRDTDTVVLGTDYAQSRALLAAVVARLEVSLQRRELTLPSLPEVALKIRRALADDDVSISEIVRLLGADPALAARVLRTANSALFYRGTRPITSLTAAVSQLGYKMIRNVALSFAAQQVFVGYGSRAVRNFVHGVWQHSVRTAVLAHMLARVRTQLDADEAFLAGLLHEIGKLYILLNAKDEAEALAADPAFGAVLAAFHPRLGRAVLEAWEISADLALAVGEHEAASLEAPAPPQLVSVLAVANYFAEHNERACSDADFYAEVPNLGSLATDRPTFDWLMRAADVDVRLLMIAFGV
jgi:HD-like signal output (HDOD) protein